MREAAAATPTAERLRALLNHALRKRQPPAAIASLTRRPSHYRSSYPLEEITVTLDDGERLELMLKLTNRALLTADALAAKPDEVYDPRREVDVYRSILSGAPLGTARCYAAIADDDALEYWVCMETVSGVELYQVGDIALWTRVAEWLADFHARFAAARSWRDTAAADRLLKLDASLMQTWLDRARAFAHSRRDARASSALDAAAASWHEVIETLVSWPQTLLHGECYASNILVDADQEPIRVCLIDWEMAAEGPGIIDLAALTAGRWPGDEPQRIAAAYARTAARHDSAWPDRDFDHALTCARAFVSVQWLGWSRDWTPPADHQLDWTSALLRSVGAIQRSK